MTDATKPCPFCGEQILPVALKCKHCQSMLGVGATPRAPAVRAPKVPAKDGIGLVLALIPWVGTALCWFWVSESMLLTASSHLTTVAALVVLGSAVLAAVDANASGFRSPVGAFISVVLLWLVLYPAHMIARARYGAPSRTASVVLGTIAFFASWLYFTVLIDQQMTELQRAFEP